MSIVEAELECLVDFAGTARWRRMEATKHPEDNRNERAAHILERMAAGVSSLEGSKLHHQLQSAYARLGHDCDPDDLDGFETKVSDHLRSVGFGYEPVSTEQCLEDLAKRL